MRASTAADVDGAFPPGFYSSTNLETEVRIDAKWLRVVRPEMDCGIVVEDGVARTIPMGEVETGMTIVMRGLGIRVLPLEKPRAEDRAELRVHVVGHLERETESVARRAGRQPDARRQGARQAHPVGCRPGGRPHRARVPISAR